MAVVERITFLTQTDHTPGPELFPSPEYNRLRLLLFFHLLTQSISSLRAEITTHAAWPGPGHTVGLIGSTCPSIQRRLHARLSANNKGFDCGGGCMVFLDLAIVFQGEAYSSKVPPPHSHLFLKQTAGPGLKSQLHESVGQLVKISLFRGTWASQ
ncbi:hypothetical protein H920_12781 [Fukomys damarensis]|uniref:Uncharacterized protein n=1 Tax=Fukomys damarensis TaxID=885580 RepID=A0A091D5U8_FUKDA|nr:hypothetical protein H920_12781 [Fukomys damarensis]